MATIRNSVGILVCVWLLAMAPFARADEAEKAYQIKAAFLYNFTKFVEWPGDKTIPKQSVVNVCTLGGNPFTGAAAEVFSKASSSALKLSLVPISSVSEVGKCHMVFLSAANEGKLSALLEATHGQPVLTVSDMTDFIRKGGMIGFASRDNKVKLTVNTVNAAQSSLRIDAQLLEIALEVIRN